MSVEISVQASKAEAVSTAVRVRRNMFFMAEERGAGKNLGHGLHGLTTDLRQSVLIRGIQLLIVVGRDDELLAHLDLVRVV